MSVWRRISGTVETLKWANEGEEGKKSVDKQTKINSVQSSPVQSSPIAERKDNGVPERAIVKRGDFSVFFLDKTNPINLLL